MRRLPLPDLMAFHPCHPFRCATGARQLMERDWREAFPAPKRRRLTFPKNTPRVHPGHK